MVYSRTFSKTATLFDSISLLHVLCNPTFSGFRGAVCDFRSRCYPVGSEMGLVFKCSWRTAVDMMTGTLAEEYKRPRLKKKIWYDNIKNISANFRYEEIQELLAVRSGGDTVQQWTTRHLVVYRMLLCAACEQTKWSYCDSPDILWTTSVKSA